MSFEHKIPKKRLVDTDTEPKNRLDPGSTDTVSRSFPALLIDFPPLRELPRIVPLSPGLRQHRLRGEGPRRRAVLRPRRVCVRAVPLPAAVHGRRLRVQGEAGRVQGARNAEQGEPRLLSTVSGGMLCKRFCNMFSGSSPCLLGQHGSCSSAQQPVEL